MYKEYMCFQTWNFELSEGINKFEFSCSFISLIKKELAGRKFGSVEKTTWSNQPIHFLKRILAIAAPINEKCRNFKPWQSN